MKRPIRLLCYFLVLIVSMGLITYAWWLWQIDRGNRAVLRGDTDIAVELFSLAEAPFFRFPWLARLLKGDYQRLIFNHVAVLYARDKQNEAVAKLEQGKAAAPFLAERGEYALWTGNFLIRRAVQSKNPETSLSALKSALAEYQRGLTLQPDDWDLKYNYELVKHILSQRSPDKKEEKVKSILEQMRPKMEPSQQEMAPEKRG